jgi:hypothetical protein
MRDRVSIRLKWQLSTVFCMAEPNLQQSLKQLYNEDFVRWIEATAACLHARDAEHLDWEG